MPNNDYAGMWQMAAAQGASSATTLGLQRLGVNYDQRKQREQAQAFMNMQMQGEKSMGLWKNEMERKMMEDSWKINAEGIKKAGYNPQILGGGSGQIGGSTPTVSASTATDPNTRGSFKGIDMGMGMLMAAQIENIKANTNKTNVEAGKIGGVDTTKVETEIKDITQGIDNKKAQRKLTEVQTDIAEIEKEIKDKTKDDAIDKISSEADIAVETTSRLHRENLIGNETYKEIVNSIKAQYTAILLNNELTRAGINVEKEKLNQMIKAGLQKWEELRIAGQNADTNKLKQMQDEWANDVAESTQLPIEVAKQIGQAILFKEIIGGKSHTPIQGFRK